MVECAILHQAAPYDPKTGKQYCGRCGELLLKGGDGVAAGPAVEVGPLVMPYQDTMKFKGQVIACTPPVESVPDSAALPMTAQQYLEHYEQAPRMFREAVPIDVWPTTLAVLIDPEAPRRCMYADVNGGSPPCGQPAWFVLEKNEHIPCNLYGCRKHTPLMCVVQEAPKRLVRP